FGEKLCEAHMQLDEQFSQYRISEALMTRYKLFWDEFSAWYLEIVKPEYGCPIDAQTYGQTVNYFERMMQLPHPFMPFITEEIWQNLEKRKMGDSIMNVQIPTYSSYNNDLLASYDEAKEIVAGIRNVRKDKQIAFKERIDLFAKSSSIQTSSFSSLIQKLGNVSSISECEQEIDNAVSFRIGIAEFFIPITVAINSEEEKQKIQEELQYTKGFLEIVNKKLSNEKFVSGAPAQVVEAEQKKKTDALEKIEMLEKRLQSI